MPVMLLLSAAHAVLATAIGYWLSHPAVLNTSSSGAISAAGFGLFLASWLLAPRRGLASQWRSRHRLRQTMADENLVKAVHELTTGAGAARGPSAGGPPPGGAAVAATAGWASGVSATTSATCSNSGRGGSRRPSAGPSPAGGPSAGTAGST
jgi:uncharacterized protein (TIGR03382 family)